jgi:16S rRNA (cytidine1402-2'-O)-methyltransferase
MHSSSIDFFIEQSSNMLYLVATPIGNLGDITLRAIATLRKVDVVASEDTRKTGMMMQRLGIEKKPQVSFHDYNEQKAGEKLVSILQNGQSVALVTNAGTPGISDPGFSLVRRAAAAGIPMTAIPGPTAFVMALVLSGLPAHNFTFRGFPPHKSGARRSFLQADIDSLHTLIYYESSHRIKLFLQDSLEVFGDRRAALANDLTKLFERVDRGTLSEIITAVQDIVPKGEYTVVIEGKSKSENKASE